MLRRPSPTVRGALLATAFALAVADAAPAQAIGQGFELERTGRADQAAELYLATVRASPTDVAALHGLERVLPQLDRARELLPLVQRAVTLDAESDVLRGLLLRTCVALNLPDSAEVVARRWARERPRDETPYREWAIALSDVRAYDAARDVLLAGRKALGRGTAFAIEIAELAQRAGHWEAAAHEWGGAVTAVPDEQSNAAAQLADAPRDQRDRIIQLLTLGGASRQARRLAAELALAWGDPARAWGLFEATLEGPSAEAVYALRRFADLAAEPGTPGAWRVRGLALSRFADMVPEPLAARARADAARAFLESGDAGAAAAQLAQVAGDSAAPLEAQRLAQATLIRALIQAGRLDSAAQRLAQARDRLSGDDVLALRSALARAHLRRGELAGADSALAGDSSVDALALQGWIALYRGDLQRARGLFRSAGPYAGGRREATERTAMLALLERIPNGRFPDLGRALLTLARGDSAATVTGLRQAADRLTPEGGRGDVLVLAGQIAERLGPQGEATAALLFDEVVRAGGAGAAPPAAELAWAVLLLRQGRTEAAVTHLEHLILTYPESAVVPEARRALERAKGAIPES